MSFGSTGLLRAGAVALASSLLLSGCGAFFAVRMARNVVGDRNDLLQAQREATWLALWPALQARCQALAAELPLPATLPLKVPTATLLLDTRGLSEPDDNALLPPRAVLKTLAVASTQRASLSPGQPAGADYVVGWRRTPVPSDWPQSLTGLTEMSLQVKDRDGRLVAQDNSFALSWLGGLQPEYLSCYRLQRAAAQHPAGEPAPDFIFLKEVFGVRAAPQVATGKN
ncbi:MAG TPA: hypothetical protein VLA61_01505 [Ideonella sp.]|uniref:hypothetical protein n=1 Tax=Ideonella sp. TaxID=1929293 RepID=UPI002B868821|nr:hypothetical protein [Ideonella sp.]HSI46925.1 hypothetical protein [Ideonella sp.]